jgi:N-acylneuraminate cytidylyltransferase
MIDGRKILGIIPARGGSKRLPRKNVLPLDGKPLIEWTIDATLASKYIDVTMVSTDCHEISDVAKNCGANVPYLRKNSLSNDTSSSMDVILDVLSFYEEHNQAFDFVMLLQPTSPLRTVDNIDGAIESFIEKSAGAIVSVTECDHSPLWSNTLSDNLSLNGFISKEVVNQRSQDLPTYYRLNGAIYIFDIKSLKKSTNYLSFTNIFAFIMDKMNSVDIDDEHDFIVAEALLKKSQLLKS